MKRLMQILFFLSPVVIQAQTITTFAGDGATSYSGEGVQATAAGIPDPGSGVFDMYGNYYFADALNSDRVRKIDITGIITTVAGNGTVGLGSDGVAATATSFNYCSGVCLDAAGNMYIADNGNNKVRKVNAATGLIYTIAGNGTGGFSGDGGPATNAELYNPINVCVDNIGNVYIADYWNNRVRKVDTTGIITTVAGGGTSGILNGGPATATQLLEPASVALDNNENLYFAENSSSILSNRVFKVDHITGIITTIAGTGAYTYAGDGIPATAASMTPLRIALDGMNRLYISDNISYRVYMVDTNDTLYTIAGNGTSGFFGDAGPATAAEFNYPAGLAIDLCGNLYVSDINNRRIRKIAYPPLYAVPSITLSGNTTVSPGTTVTVNATVSNASSSYTIHWYNHGVQFTTTTVPAVTYTKAAGIDTITAKIVPTGYGCWDSTTSAAHMVSSTTTGISTAGSMASVMVYPNPAHDVITVASPCLSTGGEVIVCNILGQSMLHETISNSLSRINVSNLPAGIYFIKITASERQVAVTRFVKE